MHLLGIRKKPSIKAGKGNICGFMISFSYFQDKSSVVCLECGERLCECGRQFEKNGYAVGTRNH